jgi:hypothetical protein
MVILQPEPRVIKWYICLVGIKNWLCIPTDFSCLGQQSSLPLAFPVHAVNGNPLTRAQSQESDKVALWELKIGCVYQQIFACST